MKSAGKARSNGLYRHIRTSKEIIRNLLNYYYRDERSIQRNSFWHRACGTALIEKELEEEGIVPYCPKSVPTALQRNF